MVVESKIAEEELANDAIQVDDGKFQKRNASFNDKENINSFASSN